MTEVNGISRLQRIIVDPASYAVSVIHTGPAGPPGPLGPIGPPGPAGGPITWPVTAPATPSGNISFAPSNVDVRGLRTVADANTFLRILGGAPVGWQLKANSGPLTAGEMGNVYIDADKTVIRGSNGTPDNVIISNTAVTVKHPLTLDATSDLYSPAITVLPSTHATSERAAMYLGDWMVGQDLGANGTKDFYIYNPNYGTSLKLTTSRQLQVFGAAGILFADYAAGWYMQDVDWIRSSPHVNLYVNSRIRCGTTFEFQTAGWVVAHATDTDTGLYYYGADQIALWAANGGIGIRVGPGDNTFNGNVALNNGQFYSSPNGWIRVRGTSGLYWEDYGVGFSADSGAAGYVKTYPGSTGLLAPTGQIQSSRQAGPWYYDTGFYTNPAAAVSAYSFHPGGIAASIRVQNNDAQYHFGNLNSTGYYAVQAAAFTVNSSEKVKQDLVPFVQTIERRSRDEIAALIRALRPTWFRQHERIVMLEVPKIPEGVEPCDFRPAPEEHVIHICRLETCGHTMDDPCSWRSNWSRGSIGFVVEEVEKVLPALVRLNLDMEPAAIDLGSLIGLAYAMLQEVDNRLSTLEEAAV